ncbi:hypothetical protein E3E12_03265 [Formicincola oecophyllae]|uniref:Uncharacterized protein n=1 Tax=Formicincola oecophyllae TaxID=2558361 RepID=A0A4Y6U7S1_9PROT|nr:hypothetical protein [Formicincola oecophyllae]QDH13382.1 hypothetical protein E3E12_03265 [Formicincola oecophyllae]
MMTWLMTQRTSFALTLVLCGITAGCAVPIDPSSVTQTSSTGQLKGQEKQAANARFASAIKICDDAYMQNHSAVLRNACHNKAFGERAVLNGYAYSDLQPLFTWNSKAGQLEDDGKLTAHQEDKRFAALWKTAQVNRAQRLEDWGVGRSTGYSPTYCTAASATYADIVLNCL